MKDNKQLPQLIVLCVLFALFVGYFVVKFAGSKPKLAQATQEQSTQTQTVKKTDTATEENGVEAQVTCEIPSNTDLRDPFRPTMILTNDQPAQQRETTRVVRAPRIPVVNELPPFIPKFGDRSESNSADSGSSSIQQNQNQGETVQYIVTGVITGTENVAIIRSGESRYIVKKGQFLNGTCQVVSITQSGVTIVRDGRSVLLKLGGEGNAN